MASSRSLTQLRAFRRGQKLEHDMQRLQTLQAQARVQDARNELTVREDARHDSLRRMRAIAQVEKPIDLLHVDYLNHWLTHQESRCSEQRDEVAAQESAHTQCRDDLAQIDRERQATLRVQESWERLQAQDEERRHEAELEDLWLSRSHRHD